MATVSCPSIESQAFFDSLSRDHRGVLVIDFDSTIARLSQAKCAFPFPTVREVLETIVGMTGTRVIVASSRPAEEVRQYFSQPGPEICKFSELSVVDAVGDFVPLAYVTGEGEVTPPPASRLRSCPRFRIAPETDKAAPAEDLVQFLIEWLWACAGEIC
jgi:hypothetical protein